jgi:DNA-binding transcriptional ArsR family regulator
VNPPGAKRAGQNKKTIEEVVSYALGHRIRIRILLLLNEGNYTAAELAELIDEPLNNVSNHVRELVDAGSIEIAEIRPHHNFSQNVYRAAETPLFTREDFATMPLQQRKVTWGMIIQSMTAEVLASFAAGKMNDDPDVVLAWDWLNVDAQGRKEVSEEQVAFWDRLVEIEAESINRVAVSGEDTVSYIVGELGFERARKAPKPSRSPDGDRGASAD